MTERRQARTGAPERRTGTRPRDGEPRPRAPHGPTPLWPLVAGLLAGVVLASGVALGVASAPGGRGQVAPARAVSGPAR